MKKLIAIILLATLAASCSPVKNVRKQHYKDDTCYIYEKNKAKKYKHCEMEKKKRYIHEKK